jgi:hypothetical protein
MKQHCVERSLQSTFVVDYADRRHQSWMRNASGTLIDGVVELLLFGSQLVWSQVSESHRSPDYNDQRCAG